RGYYASFVDPDRALTYAALQALSFQFAAALTTQGLRPEDRIALLLPDTVDYPVAFWGAVRAGIVVIPLNTLLTAEQYAYILADSRVSTIVAAPPLAKTVSSIIDRLPQLRTIVLVGAGADDATAAFAGRD